MEFNRVYCTDNLKLLQEMDNESVDLIYCDILYNTGKKFKDYDDRLGTPRQAMDWYRPRLIEMKRVLKDNGSIYLQCDFHLSHYIKIELDYIFGYNNLINEIIWQYPKGIKNSKNKEICNHDTILRYSKSNRYIHNVLEEPYTKEQLLRFKHEDEDGKFYYDTRRDKNNNKIKVKVYLKKQGTPLGDVWYFNFEQGKNRVGYNTQKPKLLLERIIKTSSNEGCVIADFFCGSGTSMVVAKELGRNYIGCDVNPRAVGITNERLNEVDKNCI